MVKADKILDALKNKMDIFGARKLYYLRERRTWTCLAATPNNLYGTVSSTIEFRDELRDRYGFGILSAPSYCDGCNLKFSITHALGCKKCGLIQARHDKSHHSLGCLAYTWFQPSNVRDNNQINPCCAIGGKGERKEDKKLVESNSGVEIKINADRGDLLIRGFWDRNSDCIIDVRIYDINQASY